MQGCGECAEARRRAALCLAYALLKLALLVPLSHLSSDDPRLAVFSALTQGPRPGELIVEGEFAVQRLLESSLDVQSIVATPRVGERLHALSPETEIYLLSAAELKNLAGFAFHRGCLAAALRPTLKKAPLLPRAVVAMGLCDPLNLGALIRNAKAFGASALWLGPRCGDPFSRKATRASMGHNLSVPLFELDDAASELRRLETQGIASIAAALGPKSIPLPQLKLQGDWTLWVGNEGHGLDAELTQGCSHKVQIPMAPDSDSVNVATATGIFLYALNLMK